MSRFSSRPARLVAGVAVLAVVGTGVAHAALTDPNGAIRHTAGDQTSEVAAQITYGKAKNVLLFIGDGMGDSEITVARNYLVGAAGTLQGLDSLPLTGQYTTYALHKSGTYAGKPDYVPDSASTGTGWATGTKSYNGAISVGLDGTTPHQTLLEWAKTQGLRTGNVTTAEIQDATPAVQASHVADRGCYYPTAEGNATSKNMAKCPAQAKTDATPDQLGSITEQIINTRADVTFGGGLTGFQQKASYDYPDTANLDEKANPLWKRAQALGYQTLGDGTAASTESQLAGVTSLAAGPVLGLFATGNMNTRFKATPAKHYAAIKTGTGSFESPDTCVTNDAPAWPGNQPTLAEMTDKAIDLLDDEDGFFLQVEGASIDKQDHAANPCGQIGETLDLDEAVKVGMDFAKTHGDTLVIVTADHAHSSQIINAEDVSDASPSSIPPGLIYTLKTHDEAPMTISYGTADTGGSQQHTGSQVRIAGYGPGAANVVGLSDQTDVFSTIKRALSGTGIDAAPAPTVKTVKVNVSARACATAKAHVTQLTKQVRKAHGQRKRTLAAQLKGVKSVSRFC